MRTKVHFLSFDEVQAALAAQKFDVGNVSGVANQLLVRKYGAGAILVHDRDASRAEKKNPQPSVRWIERPGFMLGGEVATLLDKGYQKFWKSSRLEVPATADSLRGVHRFAEELREIVGEPSFYNESLGTTSDSYQYDRVKGRDLPLTDRPKKAWELPAKS